MAATTAAPPLTAPSAAGAADTKAPEAVGKLKLDPKYDNYDFPTTSPIAQSGHAGHTTPEQDEAVVKLRSLLEKEGFTERLDTLSMLRFLRARKFNVDLSKQMFIDCEKWRKSFGGVGVDELLRTFDYKEKEEVFKYYPQYYHKTDKDGRPVYIESLGNVDITAMYKITSAERMLQNLVCEYEKMVDPRLPACSRKSNNLLETCCTIMDFKGVGLSKASQVYSYVQQASGISQNYYPERLGKLYIINAPWGFSGVFSFVKKFLDPVTVAKIHVFGSGYEKELLAHVPKENLPKQFGGTCECGGGCQLSDTGPWHDPEWAKPPKWAKKPETAAAADPATAKDGAAATTAKPETAVEDQGAAVSGTPTDSKPVESAKTDATAATTTAKTDAPSTSATAADSKAAAPGADTKAPEKA